ncbi:hypothetical protein [Companilactobacillus zhachilii]|uniref:hypothetical protein n=1 Tax=Companilactobacillus zhachilii TaxID=2304606 RepID=UPI00141FF502|nr:hypothetical protein [Companilactobacillus zhachilii]
MKLTINNYKSKLITNQMIKTYLILLDVEEKSRLISSLKSDHWMVKRWSERLTEDELGVLSRCKPKVRKDAISSRTC